MDSTTSFSSTTSTIKSPTSQSGEATDDASDVEDNDYFNSRDARRSIGSTPPTPATPKTPNQATRTLRKRKSSLSIQASPVTGVRSNSRAAENALSRHISRSRSGSVNSLNPQGGPGAGNENASPPGMSSGPGIRGRMRSGSVGTALKPTRRGVRRVPNNPLPPPSAPLPPLPPPPANGTAMPVKRAHSRSISLVPRIAGLGISHEPLPPMPPTPPFKTGGGLSIS
ncbi:hypothetical protein V5O48_009702 [Marasmius crinis-equi]|uniref:Uncharacterized protein n=1 Tax=Marasmius crinis-equi TaxID=585013 RepID=A0ABR3FAG8_9AGAR